MRILRHIRFDDAMDRMTYRIELRQQLQGPMADLLDNVGLAVGHMHFDMPPRLIDAHRIARQAIALGRIGQRPDDLILGLGANVEIAGIIPSADIEAWNMLARRKARVCGRPLPIKVNMLMIDRGLARVVAVGISMPCAIGFVHRHMVHRNREIDVVGRVPGIVIDGRVDPEGRGAHIAIFQHIKARFTHRAEIQLQIMVPQIIAPFPRAFSQHSLRRAIGANAQQLDRRPALILPVQFDRCDLWGVGRIAQLRMRDHRRAQPAGVSLRRDRPLQHRTGPSFGQQRSQDEPTILRLIAPIEQGDRLIALNRDPFRRIFRREDELSSARDRQRLRPRPVAAPARRIALGGARHVAGGIQRKQPALTIGHIGVMEIGRRQELQIETGLPHQRSGQRLVQDHLHL